MTDRNQYLPDYTLDTDGFQYGVNRWMGICFTPEIVGDVVERGDRFGEEALELMQAVYAISGDDFAARAHALVGYVANRPVGVGSQEVGGVMVTLAALCNALTLDIGHSANIELERILDPVVTEKIRAKQASKPTGSALPVPVQPVASQGWIVGAGDGVRWRVWNNGVIEWTIERDEATRYARREDAENVHREDEDAWAVVPF